jgi:hypothetical protein
MKKIGLILLLFPTCLITKISTEISNHDITLEKTSCGSYEVKNNLKLIGFLVKPFYVQVDKKEKYISEFEDSLTKRFTGYYDKLFRVYWFGKNRVSDTIIFVYLLSPKQLALIPDAKCEEQEADLYNKLYKKKGTKHPFWFIYNCSKGRFRQSTDPD